MPSAPEEGYRAPTAASLPTVPAGPGPAVVVTGEYGERVLAPVRVRLEALAGRPIRLLAVPNDYFAGNVAVSGLMVGEDVSRALAADEAPAARYLVPDIALSGDLFLDEMTLAEVGKAARAPIAAVPASAAGLIAGARA